MKTISVRKYHSINLLPCFEAVSVASDNGRQTIGRYYSLCWLGIIVAVVLPSNKTKLAKHYHVPGPLYSKKRKKWYWN